MFPVVRRVPFLWAIALKLNAVLVPCFFFFFFASYDYGFTVHYLACSSGYGRKNPPIPLGKSQSSKSLCVTGLLLPYENVQ